MKLSIVIVSYQSAAYLPRCLASIEQFKPSVPFEVIVVDNASRDGSATIVRERFPAVTLLVNSANLGFGRGCNRGIDAAKGEYILLLNPDTQVTPRALDALVQQADRLGKFGTLGARLVYPDGHTQPSIYAFPGFWAELRKLFFIEKMSEERARRNTLTPVDCSWGAALLFRRSLAGQLVHLDPSIFLYSEDLELCWRMRRRGLRNFVTARAQIIHAHNKSGEQLLGALASEQRLREMKRTLAYVTNRYWRGPWRGARFWFYGQLVALNARLRILWLSTIFRQRFSSAERARRIAEHRTTARVFSGQADQLATPAPLQRAEKMVLVLAVGLCIALASVIAVQLPRGRGNDEDSHVTYVRYMADYGSLPNPTAIDFGVNREPHQPPLYYLAGAGWLHLVRPLGLGVDSLRMFTLLIGLGTLYLVWCTSRELLPVGMRVLPVLLFASLPMLGQLFATVNNDSLAILLAAGMTYLVVRTWQYPHRAAYYFWGMFIGGLAVLSKLFAAPLVLVLGLVLLLQASKTRQVRWVLLGGVLAGSIGLPWFIHNYQSTGWLIAELYLDRLPELAPFTYIPDHSTPYSFVVVLFQTLVGRLGSWDIILPTWYYALFFLLGACATVGLVVRRFRSGAALRKRFIWVGLLVLALELAVLVFLNLKVFQPQARYLYPAVSFFVVAGTVGLTSWRISWRFLALALLALASLSLGIVVVTL